MIRLVRRLRELGVLGMNGRNAEYIAHYNLRRCYPLVDDKLRTKRLAQSAGIAVPRLYAVIEIERQISQLARILEPYQDFVIKPAHGSGGAGIIVVTGRVNGRFCRANGTLANLSELAHHVSNILSGMHSLGGQADQAIIEQRVVFDPLFEQVSYRGVPDIRTIVFRGVPVMAMVRLPTRQSDGKANLHQGAVGAGIDLRTGVTSRGVWLNQLIDEHPDTGHPIAGLAIPRWRELLELSARCYELVKLGYLGVDVVLDRHRGPLLLELNARPGLSIQLANGCGLSPRLRRLEACNAIPATAAGRAALAQAWFGSSQMVESEPAIGDLELRRLAGTGV